MWDLEPDRQFNRQYKYYEKKHPRELTAVMSNLEVVQQALLEGADPQKLPYGFVHREPKGALAIDQKRGGAGLAETRLYLYLDVKTFKIHLITIGDKNTQKDDLKTVVKYVQSLREAKSQERGDDG